MPTTRPQDWKAGRRPSELTFPSGNVALVRNAGLQSFISRGMIPNVLMPIVEKALSDTTGGGIKPTDFQMTSEKVVEYMQFIDTICVDAFVDPAVELPPSQQSERDPDKLYVDEIDDQDKYFLLQWVMGGTRDLEQFRQQQGALVATLSNVNRDQTATVSPTFAAG